MLVKLADLYRRQRRRTRQPFLVGKVGDFCLILVDRHDPKPGDPIATLFMGPKSETAAENKPLPPIWDAKTSTWIGPAHPGLWLDLACRRRPLATLICYAARATHCVSKRNRVSVLVDVRKV